MTPEKFSNFLKLMPEKRLAKAAIESGFSGEDSEVMAAMLAVMHHRKEIIDPDGYVDIERLTWIKDLVLPLEEQIDTLLLATKQLYRLCYAQAKCILDMHEDAFGSGDGDGLFDNEVDNQSSLHKLTRQRSSHLELVKDAKNATS